jgi:hypothetical protein
VARFITEAQFQNLSGVTGLIINDGVSAVVCVDGHRCATLQGGCYDLISDDELQRSLDAPSAEIGILGNIRKFLRKIKLAVVGKTVREALPKTDELPAHATMDQVIDHVLESKVISMYMKTDATFPLLFGVTMNHGEAQFTPLSIRCKHVDAEVGLSLLLQIDDFDAFIAHYFQSNDSVTAQQIQASLQPIIIGILREELRDEEIDEYGCSLEARDRILRRISELNGRLSGLRIVSVGDITCSSQEFERFRTLTKELYCNEKELDFLKRTNDFKNRLASVENAQKVEEAKTDLDLKKAIADVNHDSLLHDDEEEQFRMLLTRQRTIRRAQSDLELQRALNDIRRTRLVTDDEMVALEESLKEKQFERDTLNEVMRVQSLEVRNKKQIEVQAELLKYKIDKEAEVQGAGANAQHRLHLDDLHHNEEELDALEAIYGKQYASSKARLLEQIESNSLVDKYKDTRALEEAKLKNELLLKELEGHQRLDDYTDERQRKQAEFEDSRARSALNLEQQKERNRLDSLKEQQERALSALERMKQMKEAEAEAAHRREMEKEQLQREERMNSEQLQHEERMSANQWSHDEKMSQLENEKNYSAEQLFVSKLDPNSTSSEIYATHFSAQKELEAERHAHEQIEAERRRQETLRSEQEEKRDRERQAHEQQMKEQMDRFASFAEKAMTIQAANIRTQQDQSDERETRNFDRLERIATHRMDETYTYQHQRNEDIREQKEEYRDQMKHEQQRHDEHQDKALNYTTHLAEVESKTPKPAAPEAQPIREVTYIIDDLGGGNFTLAQVKGLIQSGTIHKLTVLKTSEPRRCYAEDIPELKTVFNQCDFVVCPHCKAKVDREQFCSNCGREL